MPTPGAGTSVGSMFGPWGTVIGAGFDLFGTLFGANKQAESSRYAADISSRDNAAALAFMKRQAQNAYANSEAARRANYEQWAARERRLGSVGRLLGWGPREIPAYVPGVDPRFVDPRSANPQFTDYREHPSVGAYLR